MLNETVCFSENVTKCIYHNRSDGINPAITKTCSKNVLPMFLKLKIYFIFALKTFKPRFFIGYINVKRIVNPKKKILSLIIHLHVIPKPKAFIHLQNTNEDIFDEN